MEQVRYRTKKLAILSMMLAMIAALSFLEHLLPPLPLLPPNVRLGLSNIITMYALFFLGRRSAVALAVLKSGFVLLMRGPTASLLSLCGGLLSVTAIILLAALLREKISLLLLSVAGAITHNIGQMAVASLLLQYNLLVYTLPVLVVFGVLMGCITGVLLQVVMPLFRHTLNEGKK